MKPQDRAHIAAVVRAVQSVLSVDLLSKDYEDYSVGTHPPTTGHCYAASEAVFHLLGGKAAGLVAHVARDGQGTHWWLVDADGEIIDPTAEQYPALGRKPPYAQGYGTGFLTKKPSLRATEIMRRVEAQRMRAHRPPLARHPVAPRP